MAAHLVDERDDRELLFVSYSHADDVWAQRFGVLLKPLLRRRRLRLWVDRAIRVGDCWRPEIEQAISRSRMALVLVSADYLASDFIVDDELPALERHRVRLAPVLVGDCLWQEVPELSGVQWLHDPGRDGALALHGNDAGQRDRRIRQACERLLDLTPDSSDSGRPVMSAPVAAGAPIERVTDGLARGGLSQVPALPLGYLARDELAAVIELVIGGAGAGAVGLTGASAGMGLHGMGGIGKSVLAAALARDERIGRRFSHGVYWVTVGEQPDLLGLQLDLMARLGVVGEAMSARTVAEATGRLQQAAADLQVLLVIDDVWSDAAAQAFRITGPRGRLLYTSRDEQVITAAGSVPHRIGVLSRETARAMAAGILGVPAATLPIDADRTFAHVGWVPLAVALVSAAVRGGRSWQQVCTYLDDDPDTFGDHPYANTFRAISLSAAGLPPELREALLSLAVFPADTEIPTAAVIRYWAHMFGGTPDQIRANLGWLAAANLLRHNGTSIGFHDLQHDYLLLHAPPLALLHGELVAAYRRVLPDTDAGRWWRLPVEEPYVWDHLVEHLGRAGDRRALVATVTDPAYQAQRITDGGPHAGEADLASAARFVPDDQLVSWWQGWLGRHAHLLGRRRAEQDRQRRGSFVAATMMAWLHADATRPAEIAPDHLAKLLTSPYPALVNGLIAPTGELVRVLTGHTGKVNAVAWSSDSTRLASASTDQIVRVWDSATGQTITTLTGHTGDVHTVTWSPDNTRVATGSADRTVRVWDPVTGQTISTLTGHTGDVYAVAWSPDSTRLATGSADRTVRVWDHVSGQTISSFAGHTGDVYAVTWSPDSSRLASAGADHTVRIWGRASRTLEGHTGEVYAVAWSPNGTHLASAGADTTVRMWDSATGQTTSALTGHADWVNAVAWSPDGVRLAAVADKMVRIWDIATGQTISVLTGNSDWAHAVAWSPDGKRLAAGADDQTIRIWDPNISHTTMAPLASHIGAVRAVAWSPDGTRLASAGFDRTVRIWNRATWENTATLEGHTGRVRAVVWSPEGTRLASAGRDGTVRIWDPTTGQTITTLIGHTDRIRAVAWSPDGNRLASAGTDQPIRIWDPTTGQTITTLIGHTARIRALAWSPDGNRLASAGTDHTIRIWDPTTGQTSTSLTSHTDDVNAVAWSPDGACLATASSDRTVRIWNTTTMQTTTTITAHTSRVRAVTWSPDGAHLATACDDGLILFWSRQGRERTSIAMQTAFSLAWLDDLIAIGHVGPPTLVKLTDDRRKDTSEPAL